jgi:RNA polymerase sigma-70 factor (ECF subfamily)
MDEQELIRRVQHGDEVAFAEIVTAYKDRIVNYLYQFTGDYQKAVELSQETFLRVFFKAKQYRPVAPLSSWIYAIASNLAKTEMKKARRVPIVSLDEIASHEVRSKAFAQDRPDSGMLRNLRQALDELRPRYRIPVILKDMEGFSQEEIARIIKRPVGTVKARISRGREHLKKMLEKAAGTGPGPEQNEVSQHGRA